MLRQSDATGRRAARRVATRLVSPGALAGAVPLVGLVIRLYLAAPFWDAGRRLLAGWEETLWLVEHHLEVTPLTPTAAAVAAIAVQLLLAPLLALGLCTRLAAAGLLLFTVAAAVALPGLSAAGLQGHIQTGLLLLVPLVYGPGPLALDELLVRTAATHRRRS